MPEEKNQLKDRRVEVEVSERAINQTLAVYKGDTRKDCYDMSLQKSSPSLEEKPELPIPTCRKHQQAMNAAQRFIHVTCIFSQLHAGKRDPRKSR